MSIEIQLMPDAQLSEIYQSVKTKFAFVSSAKMGNQQCTVFAQCRDFLHDAIKAHINKNSIDIYDFEYAYGKNPKIDTRLTRIAVCNDKTNKNQKAREEFEEELHRGLAYIHLYEEFAKLKRKSTLQKTKNTRRDVWLFTGPSFWMRAPFLISMYTLLIRLGNKKIACGSIEEFTEDSQRVIDGYKSKDNDLKYLASCKDKMHLVVKHAKKLFFEDSRWYRGYTDKYQKHSFHDCGGIKSLCDSATFDSELNKKFKALVSSQKR